MSDTDAVMPAAISMVVLTTSDVARLRRFYQRFGWPEQPGASDELCRFDLGSVVLALYRNPERSYPSDGEAPPTVTMVLRLAAPNAVDDATAVAIGAGGNLVSELQDQPWGGRSAVVADPDGNRWELLFSPRGAAGS
jgi:predicted enzyme related to lactoylglutathione lyase